MVTEGKLKYSEAFYHLNLSLFVIGLLSGRCIEMANQIMSILSDCTCLCILLDVGHNAHT